MSTGTTRAVSLMYVVIKGRRFLLYCISVSHVKPGTSVVPRKVCGKEALHSPSRGNDKETPGSDSHTRAHTIGRFISH